MGAYCSKSDSVDAFGPPSSSAHSLAAAMSDNDLSAYFSACESDPDLQGFESALRRQTTLVRSSISDTNSEEVPSLSLGFFEAVIGSFSEVNQEAVKYVLNSNKDVWKSLELLDLVAHYFEYSEQVLAFFETLNASLQGANRRQLLIKRAIRYYAKESKNAEEASHSVRFARTMRELRKFKEAGDIFNEEFHKKFQSVLGNQSLMLEKLEAHRQMLGKKMDSIKAYKKASLVLFAACFVGVLVFSVVAAAIAAPPLVTALAAAMIAPVGGMGKWLDSLWKQYENQLQAQAGIINKVGSNTYFTVKELDGIGVLVSKLEIGIEPLLTNAEFSLGDDSALKGVIKDMNKNLKRLKVAISNLEVRAKTYSRNISQARKDILKRMDRISESI